MGFLRREMRGSFSKAFRYGLVVSVPPCSASVPYLSKAEVLTDIASFFVPLEFLLLKAAVTPSFKIEN